MKKIELVYEEKFISQTEEERKKNFIQIYNQINNNNKLRSSIEK